MQNYFKMAQTHADIYVSADLEFGGYDESQKHYIHKYTIHIENMSDINFQLLRRRWEISDGLSWKRIVEGDGVVGQQPIISPGQRYTYDSWCPMPSTVGYMRGVFFCQQLDGGSDFTIEVPTMTFIAEELRN